MTTLQDLGLKSIHFSATTKRIVLKVKPNVSIYSDSFFEERIGATSDKEKTEKIIQLLT